MPEPIICPYCGKYAQHVDAVRIFPQRLDLHGKRKYWSCEPCGAWVPCKMALPDVPMGLLANAELRRLRDSAADMLRTLERRSGFQGVSGKHKLHERLSRAIGLRTAGLIDTWMLEESSVKRLIEELRKLNPQGENDAKD